MNLTDEHNAEKAHRERVKRISDALKMLAASSDEINGRELGYVLAVELWEIGVHDTPRQGCGADCLYCARATAIWAATETTQEAGGPIAEIATGLVNGLRVLALGQRLRWRVQEALLAYGGVIL